MAVQAFDQFNTSDGNTLNVTSVNTNINSDDSGKLVHSTRPDLTRFRTSPYPSGNIPLEWQRKPADERVNADLYTPVGFIERGLEIATDALMALTMVAAPLLWLGWHF